LAKSGRQRAVQKPNRHWRRIDLHLHTPGSSDYQEPQISYLDILRQAEVRGLDIVAFTDHNTVAGYAAMKKQIEQLEILEQLNRLEYNEKRQLDEYRRLLDKILVLPGFEFTATFGFHILGIFPPDTPVNYLEHLLLTLRVPLAKLYDGSSTVGATSDVLAAYRLINESGGLVIAAHANSSNGVVMRGLDFGGQTKIAYTQDPNLHCLEVTDLEKRGRYTTRRFFDGSKPEYPRAMRCIQGSDAHRLVRESAGSKNLGVGDRVTEILLPEVSFEALATVLTGSDFSLTRPYRGPSQPLDFVLVAREEGPSLVQAFHRSLAQRGGHLNRILEDVCAMANTNGGTIYIGVPEDPKEKIVGVREPKKSIDYLYNIIAKRLSPVPEVNIDNLVSQGQTVVRINISPGRRVPYAIDTNRFYVRDEAESNMAVRDEIVRLVERRLAGEIGGTLISDATAPAEPAPVVEQTSDDLPTPMPILSPVQAAPRTGVEIVASEERGGTIYHTVRDLRNGNLIHNVTKSSARKLWHYAISQAEAGPLDTDKIKWLGQLGFISERRRDNYTWYDLAMRDHDGIHFYYGVTESGIDDEWLRLVELYGSKS
jgi:PHP family Zn ribbon phosphoesterase